MPEAKRWKDRRTRITPPDSNVALNSTVIVMKLGLKHCTAMASTVCFTRRKTNKETPKENSSYIDFSI